jgi:hypothetical protein
MVRPHKPADDRASSAFRVRLTADERRQLDAKASSAGISITQLVRAAVLRYKAPSPPIVREAVDELHRLGVNLNQLMRHANTTGELGPERLAQLDQVLKAIKGTQSRLIDIELRRR